jgi:hypothetical protein
MLSILRAIVKRPLQLVGLDLVRYNPRYAMGEYAYVASLGIRTVIDVGAHTGEFARMTPRLAESPSGFSTHGHGAFSAAGRGSIPSGTRK